MQTSSELPFSERGLIGKLLWFLHAAEDALLALLLTGMIGLACTQIILRNFFDTGISWADPSIRVAVLWLGLLGALAASRGDNQIRIDVLSRFLKGRVLAASQLLTALFTAGVTGLIAWHSGRFVWEERSFGTTAFLDIPAWWLQVVIPLAFGLIALRYLILSGLRTTSLINTPVRDGSN